jgi:hypothetical protein
LPDDHQVADPWTHSANGAENAFAFGQVQPIFGLKQARGHSKYLGESLGSFTRACGCTEKNEIWNQAAFLEAPRHLQRFVLALAAQRTLEVAHVGILLSIGVPDQRETLGLVSVQTRTSTRPALSRASNIRKGS